ncbi:MAG: Uma2 family endonuclease [Chloroflexota bacterium]
MVVQDRLYTAEDLWALPEDDNRYELFKGTLIELPFHGAIHGLLTAQLIVLIGSFVYPHNLGQLYGAGTGFILSENPDRVLAPDLAFIPKERLGKAIDGFLTIGPDLVVEVDSPSNTKIEMQQKVEAYFEAGVRLLWIVYPKSRTIYVYRGALDVAILGSSDGMLTGGEVLPGFSVKLDAIFSVLD